MSITGAGVWGEPADTARAVAVLRAAVDCGVTFIDTADSYGPEVSERLIAEALRPYPSSLVIATKGGYVRDGPWQWRPNGRPEHLRAACEGSLRRLGLERIDLYYLHTPDPGVPLEESVGALSELRREGKIRFAGLSNVGVDAVRRAQSILPIAAVQNRYNLIDRGDDDVVRYCEGEGIAFVPWSPLAKAALTRSRGPLQRVAKRHSATPGQIALAWLLHRSPVIAPIPGTASEEHLRENVQAHDLHLEESDLEELESLRPSRLRPPASVRRAARAILARVPATRVFPRR